MGYSTEFYGSLQFSTPLNEAQVQYIQSFSETRRMKRNPDLADKMPNQKRLAVNLPIGRDGGYFTGSEEDMGQTRDSSVVEYNFPPGNQPGLWCQWTVSDDGTELVWNEAEKFYSYVEWLQYMIDNFFTPWGAKLNGSIDWEGEERGDTGTIKVVDSVITVLDGDDLTLFSIPTEKLLEELKRRNG